MKKLILLLLLITIVSGCSVNDSTVTPVLIENVRPAPVGIVEEQKQVSRSQLDRALEASRGASNVRIVPLVTSAAQAPVTPEYRVFNVKNGGIAELLGLKNADILVSAHGFVIQTPLQFYKYLQLLRSNKETRIEIRREGKPMILKVQILNS